MTGLQHGGRQLKSLTNSEPSLYRWIDGLVSRETTGARPGLPPDRSNGPSRSSSALVRADLHPPPETKAIGYSAGDAHDCTVERAMYVLNESQVMRGINRDGHRGNHTSQPDRRPGSL